MFQKKDTKCGIKGKPFEWSYLNELKNKNKNNIPNDPVSHPSHYTRGSIEAADFIDDQQLNFDRGNVVKYICRAESITEKYESFDDALRYLVKLWCNND